MCDLCEEVYQTLSDQLNCEASQTFKEDLEIVAAGYRNSNDYDGYGYPKKILIENKKKSGSAAEYLLFKEGSVEDFEPYRKGVEIIE